MKSDLNGCARFLQNEIVVGCDKLAGPVDCTDDDDGERRHTRVRLAPFCQRFAPCSRVPALAVTFPCRPTHFQAAWCVFKVKNWGRGERAARPASRRFLTPPASYRSAAHNPNSEAWTTSLSHPTENVAQSRMAIQVCLGSGAANSSGISYGSCQTWSPDWLVKYRWDGENLSGSPSAQKA